MSKIMRQTELDETLPVEAGRSHERSASFPDVLLYRGNAGDGADCIITFDRRNVVLARPVGGIACRIRLTIGQYRAVAVVAREDTNIIRLLHNQTDLTIDLTEVKAFAEAEEYCDRLADFLDLPALTLAGDRNWDEAMSGTLKRAARRKADQGKRPRFLARRHTGNVVAFARVEGRELIARR